MDLATLMTLPFEALRDEHFEIAVRMTGMLLREVRVMSHGLLEFLGPHDEVDASQRGYLMKLRDARTPLVPAPVDPEEKRP